MEENQKFKGILEKENVFIDLSANNWQQTLKMISNKLINNGIVKTSFKKAIINREEKFATGLQGTKFGVAIPHTDPEHVIKESLSVAILKKPINFIHMGTQDQKVSVQVIFTLALKTSDNQLAMLQKLMELIQNDIVLEELTAATSKSTIVDIINHELNI